MNEMTGDHDGGRALRDAFGRYATGVAVVTAIGPEGAVGITANSFTSVSLDPPLVLWCPARRSARFQAFLAADRYAIHVLASDQLHLCRHFARQGGGFEGFGAGVTPEGLPALPDVLARFDCTAFGRHEGGDHAILVARVHRVETRNGAPLLFWGGRYGDFLHQG